MRNRSHIYYAFFFLAQGRYVSNGHWCTAVFLVYITNSHSPDRQVAMLLKQNYKLHTKVCKNCIATTSKDKKKNLYE